MTLAACSAGRDDAAPGHAAHPTASLPAVDVESGVVHVHGLGVDPADGTLYAATHTGLFAVPEQGRAQRVANRLQDTMGFSVVGPGRFIASGHPDPREDDVRPPLLGLIESRNAGQTWKRLSLHGQADFHALVSAHGQVYGYDATSGTFMVSADLQSWERRSRLPMRDLAVDPSDPQVVLATTEGTPVASTDGGRSWQPLATAPRLVVLAWDRQAGLVGVAADGSVHRSDDGGRSWHRTGSAGGEPEALTVDTRGGTPRLYVAVRGSGIVVSTDGGTTFVTRYAEPGS